MTVNREIADFSQSSNFADSIIFRDFEPELYSVWNFAKATNEIKHFGKRIEPAIRKSHCILVCRNGLAVVICNPFGNRPVERGALVAALHLGERRLGQVGDVWQPALSDTRIRIDAIDRLAKLES